MCGSRSGREEAKEEGFWKERGGRGVRVSAVMVMGRAKRVVSLRKRVKAVWSSVEAGEVGGLG